MKRLAIIGSVGIPASYGGFETLTENLVGALSNTYDITVYCSSKHYTKTSRKSTHRGAKLKYIPLKANGIQSIPYDYISILRALFTADTLLILGVSGCTLLPLIRLFTRKKIIVHIDGLEWRRKKWSAVARWYLQFSEKLAVNYSHADIADNNAIKIYTSQKYSTQSHLIEYGADHVQLINATPKAIKPYSFMQSSYCFKVARIEPENNIDLILEAFSQSSEPLVIVGNWQNSAYGIALREKYMSLDHIYLLDPVYDPKTLGMLRSNARIYIHGHEAGGTNPSLVEAMYLGIPVFTFGVSFNRETTEGKANYFGNAQELLCLLEQYTPISLAKNAEKMREIAHRRYTWRIVAQKYHQLVELIQNGYVKKRVDSEGAHTIQHPLRKPVLTHFIRPNSSNDLI